MSAKNAPSVDQGDLRDGIDLTPDWADDGKYYVDGRFPRNRARHAVCMETGGWYKTATVRRVLAGVREG
jgi:hypothetical protein